MLVRIFLSHTQAHLSGIIIVTKKLNLIGKHMFQQSQDY